MPPREITPLTAHALNEKWKSLAPWGRFHKLAHLRRIYTFIERTANLERDSLRETVPNMVKPDPRENTFSAEQLSRALSGAPPWMRLILLAAYELGLRSGTVAELAPQHYDPEKQRVVIRSKGDQVHVLPVSPRLQELFAAAEPDSPVTPYWVALKGPRTGSLRTHQQRRQAVADAWKKWRDKLGLPELRLHDLRRTLACRVATETGDIFNAQAALGHKHLSTTLDYLRPLSKDTAKLRAALQAAWLPKGGPIH